MDSRQQTRSSAAPEGQSHSPRPGLARRLAREVRERPFAYAVMLAFAAIGPIVVYFLFPEAPSGVGVVGGLALGVYAALCAVPGKFF